MEKTMTKKIYKSIRQRSRAFKQKAFALTKIFAPMHFFVRNRRAISAVISNIILIGAVVSVGLVALTYARSASINYQSEYAETINSDINKIKESLTFEYAYYSSNQLTLYVMNSGPVDVTIKSISINSSPVAVADLTIHPMGSDQEISNVIAQGAEVSIVLNTIGITINEENNVKIISGSDSNFAYNF
jgi:hypothetical protein